jgi:uncharacterized protein YecT (DUF1311 family)
MKQVLFFSILIFLQQISIAQVSSPKEVTAQVLEKIKQDVELQVPNYKLELGQKGFSEEQIEFSVDTFRIEQIASKCIEINYSTAGINAAFAYDKLLNKFYAKLVNILEVQDKKVLIAAQKAWLSYRDAEAKLISTMSKDVYTGGGTMQSNITNSNYAALIANRALEIFSHYNRVLKG